MKKTNYYVEQMDKCLDGHDNSYPLTLQVWGTHTKSNHVTMPSELFLKIKDWYYLNGGKI